MRRLGLGAGSTGPAADLVVVPATVTQIPRGPWGPLGALGPHSPCSVPSCCLRRRRAQSTVFTRLIHQGYLCDS